MKNSVKCVKTVPFSVRHCDWNMWYSLLASRAPWHPAHSDVECTFQLQHSQLILRCRNDIQQRKIFIKVNSWIAISNLYHLCFEISQFMGMNFRHFDLIWYSRTKASDWMLPDTNLTSAYFHFYFCSSYWFNQMYYSEKGPYKRGSGGQTITYENSAIVVVAHMEASTYHPMLNISVIPQVKTTQNLVQSDAT